MCESGGLVPLDEHSSSSETPGATVVTVSEVPDDQVVLPSMPGSSWRDLRASDAEAIARLVDACFAVDGGYRISAGEVAEEFDVAEDDHRFDTVAAVAGSGEVLAMAWCQVPHASGTKWRVLPWVAVHPSCRREDVEDRLFDWVEARGRVRLSGVDDQLPKVFRTSAYEWRSDRIALLEARGYSRARYFDEMARPLATPPVIDVPDGINLRSWTPTTAEDARNVHNEAFSDHWGSVPWSVERWSGFQGESFMADASWVAYDGSSAVGYLMSGRYPHDFEHRGRSEAWIEGLGTVASHRGRGIGSALISAALQRFEETGNEYACIGVDSENPSGAHAIYGRLGFVVERREIVFVKDADAV
jgi:mycothiol synthase